MDCKNECSQFSLVVHELDRAESKVMDDQVQRYAMAADFIKRITNITVVQENLPYEEFVTLKSDFDKAKDVLLIMFPMNLALFEKQTSFFAGMVFTTADTIIISEPPKLLVSSSMSLLAMENQVIVLIVLGLLAVSLLLTIYAKKRQFFSSFTETTLKRFITDYLSNTWNALAVFFFEPFPTLLMKKSSKIVLGSWLLGVTFIVAMASCFLRSEFTIEDYNYIERIDQFFDNPELQPYLIGGGIGHDYLQSESKDDPRLREWLGNLKENDNLGALYSLLDFDGFKPIFEGKKSLIINKMYFTWLFGFAIGQKTPQELNNIQDKYKGLYFSKILKSNYMILALNKSFFQLENVNLVMDTLVTGMETLYECKPFDYLDAKTNHYLDKITWRKPEKTVSDLDLASILTPFKLFLMGLAMSCLCLILEIIGNRGQMFKTHNNKRKRKKRVSHLSLEVY